MAEEPQRAEEQSQSQQLEFVGMDQSIGVFADAFLLAKKEDSYQIYFFQQILPPSFTGALKETGTLAANQTRCVARIVLSLQGAVKLAEGLAANLAFEKSSQPDAEAK